MIYIESKRKSKEAIREKYPDAMIIDVTSKADDEFVKFSPFYPIGGIPVPFTDDIAVSVEGIWQGLKVFEDADVDPHLFSKNDMKNMKRTARKYGQCLGHRKGVYGEELLGYLEARKLIYLPCYKWALDFPVNSGFLILNNHPYFLELSIGKKVNIRYSVYLMVGILVIFLSLQRICISILRIL